MKALTFFSNFKNKAGNDTEPAVDIGALQNSVLTKRNARKLDSKRTEPQKPELKKVNNSKTVETKVPETKTSEIKASEPKTVELKVSSPKTPESRKVDTKKVDKPNKS